MRKQDEAIWEVAKTHLNVRNNDEHTLFSYLLAQKIAENYPESDIEIILPAILLHDTGWSKIPKDKLFNAFGPNNKYPELTRQHEFESVAIARQVLPELGFSNHQIEEITSLIDGHDTTKNARSLNDAIHKDADKLWRYTPHGNRIIGEWFEIEQAEVLEILENFVLPTFLTDFGRKQAIVFLETAKLNLNLKKYLC
ncbi:metal-dependent phosphohydrolase HD sub domain-containing protein [Emticicia oligotrophica DSM 17448]|uniref:Metal-dependent phosphohydrolase HD sub domain-containing protein n=1 Tax=Emticicia oligotrophica (strain DSM 17448 / CIP 109782 / MTCC 6937 / GPTSA100-15) TaxID=929562 RepID=A0ABN4APT7_EMTOG|nr:HD domain-containing protein [Emticicia oligotrophica]AFK04379.1 metal-dependent phosphohydrolase HD sub domain-containing protein [Emticicia oligotrophica DSM 17448]